MVILVVEHISVPSLNSKVSHQSPLTEIAQRPRNSLLSGQGNAVHNRQPKAERSFRLSALMGLLVPFKVSIDILLCMNKVDEITPPQIGFNACRGH